jgi:hypothetical protein
MFEYPASSRRTYRSPFFELGTSWEIAPENIRVTPSHNFVEALLKEVQNVVRTVAFFAPVRTAPTPGNFVVFLCAHCQ